MRQYKMDKLVTLQRTLDQLYRETDSVCLWLSGGQDSRLLLEILIEMNKPFAVLRFEDGWSREQRRQVDAVILKFNLQAFSYPALTHILVGEADNVSLVSTYPIDSQGTVYTLIRDVVDGDRHINDIQLEKPKVLGAPIEFAVHMLGTRHSDRHYITGDKPLTDWYDQKIAKKRFVYPLCDWSATDVKKALLRRGVNLSNDLDLDIHASHASLREMNWNPEKNLSIVRAALAA